MKISELISKIQSGSEREKYDAAIELGKQREKSAIAHIIGLAEAPEAYLRLAAADALGNIGGDAAGPILLQLMHDSDRTVRIEAVESLGKIQYRTALADLMPALSNDADPLLRVHVAEALGCIDDKAAVPALEQALDDPDYMVRAYSADAIANLGHRESLPMLAKKLEKETEDFTKAFLLAACYRLGDRPSLDALIRLSSAVDNELAVTLLNLGAEVVKSEDIAAFANLIHHAVLANPEMQHEAIHLLVAIFDWCGEEAEKPLLNQLKSFAQNKRAAEVLESVEHAIQIRPAHAAKLESLVEYLEAMVKEDV